jgi:drug/metabolite transporter (DMT)-like permease
LLRLFWMSFFGNALFSILMLSGLARTSATQAGLVMAALPAVVAILSRQVLAEPIGARAALAVALTIAGTVLLNAGGTLQAHAPSNDPVGVMRGAAMGATLDTLLGLLMVAGCVLCEAIYVILGKLLTGQLSARRIAALINLIGLVLVLPAGLWQARGFDPAQVSAAHWAMLLYYALAASLWAPWLWLAGLARVPAHQSGVFTIALPISATAVASALFGEPFGAAQWMALACAALGVLLVTGPTWPFMRRTR